MKKIISYIALLVATILVFLVFATAQNYTQVAFGVAIYPILAYMTLKVFPRRKVSVVQKTRPAQSAAIEDEPSDRDEETDIVDFDKRAFLKLIGAAGISFFLFSLLSKKAEIPFFGKMAGATNGPTGVTSLQDTSGNKINPAERQPMDGYQISEIDDNVVTYFGFINKEGAWLIMREDTETNSFRYARGDSDFPGSWNNRERITYDYFHNVF